MITKFLEAFFRHKLLVLLPPILIPLIVGPLALMTAPIYYESFAGVWVDKPTYLNYNDNFSIYSSASSQQANKLSEVLRTRSFMVDVAKRTSLAPLVGNPKGEDRIATILGQGFTMIPNGDHLLVLHFRADNPRLAYDSLNAIMDAFKENTADERVNQATLAISFYESRLNTAQEELKKTSTSVRQYVAANPNLRSINPDRAAAGDIARSINPGGALGSDIALPTSVTDPQLGEMMAALQTQQKQVEALRANLDSAQFDASAGLEGQEMGFQIIDPPQIATAPTRALRARLVYPIAGMVVGMGLSLVLLVLLVAGDRTVRSEGDLPGGARVLGAVPHLKLNLKKLPKGQRRDAMRRAIGFVAGTALPAPSTTGSK
jgi:uncharacterized protein involved in exopolysaccharide biosynthesis